MSESRPSCMCFQGQFVFLLPRNIWPARVFQSLNFSASWDISLVWWLESEMSRFKTPKLMALIRGDFWRRAWDGGSRSCSQAHPQHWFPSTVVWRIMATHVFYVWMLGLKLLKVFGKDRRWGLVGGDLSLSSHATASLRLVVSCL